MNKEIENHIKNKSFGLGDYNATQEKYKNYKPNLVKAFFSDNDFEDYLEYLSDRIISKIQTKTYILNMLNSHKRREINLVKTSVNDITFEINQDYIKSLLPNSNPNQLRTLTILFYLEFYNSINQEMKTAFLELYGF